MDRLPHAPLGLTVAPVTTEVPLFSVVLAAEASKQHVGAAIDSLSAQRVPDFEIIMVTNDPEGTQRLVETAARSDITMQTVQFPIADAGAGMSAGADAARGRYLAFLVAGDTFHPDRLEVFRRAIAGHHPLVWGFSGVEALDESGDVVAEDEVGDPMIREAVRLSRRPLEATRMLSQLNTIVSNGNLVVESAWYARLGGFGDLKVAYGWDLALRLLDVCAPFVAERSLYRHRLQRADPSGGTSAGQGRLTAETARVLADYRRRSAHRIGFGPVAAAMDDVSPDDAWAIRATLRTLARLRTVPPAYRAVRTTARAARTFRRALRRLSSSRS